MAKKKENQLTYLQSPLPEGRKSYRLTKRSWSGLNYRQTIDTGALSKEKNISTLEAPYMVPSQAGWDYLTNYGTPERREPICMFGFDDFLLVIYREGEDIMVDYVRYDEENDETTVYTGLVKENVDTAWSKLTCSVVQFNTYDYPTDVIEGEYIKRLLFFPFKASMFMDIVEVNDLPTGWSADKVAAADNKVLYCYDDGDKKRYYEVKTKDDKRVMAKNGDNNCFKCDGMDVEIITYRNTTAETDKSGATIYPPPSDADKDCYYQNTADIEGTNHGTDVYKWTKYEYMTSTGKTATKYGWRVCTFPNMPNIKYATVHLSRLFGVDDSRVYASGYNDYTNWAMDDIEGYNESNAWCSPAQSNTKAGGEFTGITNFQGHVVCFKRDYMHEIYNTKNPFRIQDIYAEGAIDSRTIQDVDGKLIFVSEDAVKVYTGSNPRIISYNLNIDKFARAVSGTDGRCYYLYCEDAKRNHRLFTYDTFTDCWSEQEISASKKVLSFAHNKNGMYMLCFDEDDGAGKVCKLDTAEYDIEWSFETDLITNQTVDIKHLKKIQMLVDIPEKVGAFDNKEAHIDVYVLYGDETFDATSSHHVYHCEDSGHKAIRVKPRNKKNANYGIKLHIEGKKYVKLYEMELFIENGGDLYV